MARRERLSWQQVTLGFLFIILLALGLGVCVGAAILGVKSVLEPPLSLYVGMPLVFLVVFAYGKWVWTPLWKLRASRQ